MTLLAIIIALGAVATGLFVTMFQRNSPILGVAGLSTALTGAIAAVAYGGMASL